MARIFWIVSSQYCYQVDEPTSEERSLRALELEADDVDSSSVQEVDASQVPRASQVRNRPRCAWLEARMLTSNCRGPPYASIRFNGENLSHGGKLKTMREIWEALSCVPALFPHVPHPETLDQWLDSAVAD